MSLSIADSPSSGRLECAARPVALQPHAIDAARRDAEPVVRRLAVDQEAAIRGGERVRGLRAVAAPLLADDEQQADARLAGRAQPLGGGDLRDQRALASQAPRPYRRPSSSRLGKNGGTQSKCVENTTTGSAAVGAMTLKRPSTTGCRSTT